MNIPEQIQKDLIDRNNNNLIFIILSQLLEQHNIVLAKSDAIIKKLLETESKEESNLVL